MISRSKTLPIQFGLLLILLPSVFADEQSGRTADATNWQVAVSDNFQRTTLGDDYICSASGEDSWTIQDGVLVGRQVKSDHGAVIRRMLDHADVQFECRFRFSDQQKSSRFNVVFDDSNEKSVHSGHISRVSVARKSIMLRDDKIGSMNKEVRALRQLPQLSKQQQDELNKRMKETIRRVGVKLDDDKWHRIWVRIVGSKMSVKLDGELIGELDSPGINHLTRNKFGFTVAAKSVEFDDWKVSLPAAQQKQAK